MNLSKYHNFGLLILRIGIGIAFMVHGYPKLFGGPERWAQLGETMGLIGINFGYPFWGFMAALAEFGGGILLIFGAFFPIALFLLVCTMIMAATMHIITGNGSPLHAIEAGILFFSLIFIGPGRYSVDARLRSSSTESSVTSKATA